MVELEAITLPNMYIPSVFHSILGFQGSTMVELEAITLPNMYIPSVFHSIFRDSMLKLSRVSSVIVELEVKGLHILA